VNVIEGIPAHWVFNMDELGHQERVVRKTQICFVPAFHLDDCANAPIPRTGERTTLVACIAADRSFLKPTIIPARKTVDDDRVLTG
jgi:hypothetical protein